jgi:hypothetical protein
MGEGAVAGVGESAYIKKVTKGFAMATAIDTKVHFDLAMSQDANTAVETIASSLGIDPGDVLSRAIKLFIEVEKARKEGQTVGLLDSDKKPVVEFVGF